MRRADESLTLPRRCARVELLVFDVDGVLTDGSIVYTDAGEEIKAFHVRDGSGVKWWTTLGKQAGIITGRRSVIVERRAKELGVHPVVQGADNKKDALTQMLASLGRTADQACVIGDDIADLGMMRAAGLAIAVADACEEAKQDADYVTIAPGGRGAVREAVELILHAQGRWDAVVTRCRDE